MTSYDGEWLDRMYNNRALVPAHAQHFARWAAESATARLAQRAELDIAYGPNAGETLDVFPAEGATSAPVLVFIHGGYWRSLDKADHSFVAPPFTRQGVCVVVPNYALCPAVTIPDIVVQMVDALAWTWRHIRAYGGDPSRITVAGHSAGGHLAAMLLACRWRDRHPDVPDDLVTQALSISGLYELEPLRHTPFLADSLRLTPRDAARASPVRLPLPAERTLYTVAGGEESAAFLRHNEMIQEAWGAQAVPVCEALPGLNHFSIVEALAEPGHRLHALAMELIQRR